MNGGGVKKSLHFPTHRAVTALERTQNQRTARNAELCGTFSRLYMLTGVQPTLPDWRERMLGWLDLQLLHREAEADLKP